MSNQQGKMYDALSLPEVRIQRVEVLRCLRNMVTLRRSGTNDSSRAHGSPVCGNDTLASGDGRRAAALLDLDRSDMFDNTWKVRLRSFTRTQWTISTDALS